MNILFVATHAFSSHRGGIERFCLTLGGRFAEDGHAVHYLAALDDVQNKDALQSFLPDTSSIHTADNARFLEQLVQKTKIDIILNQQADNPGWIALCKEVRQHTGCKVITILHFDPFHYQHIFRASFFDVSHSGLPLVEKVGLIVRNTLIYQLRQKRLFGHVYRQALDTSDSFVVLSKEARPRLLNMIGNDAEVDKIVAISNPVTLGADIQSRPTKKKQLLFVGRLEFCAKRPDLLLNIWQSISPEFPDWQLVVVGDGDYLPIMQRLSTQRKLSRITFTGTTDPIPYYQSSSILCITSNCEGFSLVAVEASQHYTVPIAFDSYAAVTDVIRDGQTGYIVPAFDISAYTTHLRQLMSNPAFLEQMSYQAHEYVGRFSLEAIAPQWYQLFNSLKS